MQTPKAGRKARPRDTVINVEVSQVAPTLEPTGGLSAAAPQAPRGTSVALDQWRGLALVLVLISHGFYFTGRVHGIGRVGVNLFFFISGVLVFRSLAKPDPRGPVSLAKNFWKRRLRRLYPALATYLLAMLPVVWLLQGYTSVPQSDVINYLRGLPFALAYAVNYFGHSGTMAEGHLWSLSCEMQFYLVAPVIFLLGGQNESRRKWVWGTLLVALLVGGFVGPFFHRGGKYHFEQAVWPMMLGFFCEYRKAWFQKLPDAWTTFVVRASLAFFVASLGLMLLGGQMLKLVVASGALVLVPCFLAYLHRREIPGLFGRVLAWLGERTYSIYLWQQPFTICGYLPVLWHPVGALLSTLVGGIWFQFFERPFLSGGRKQ